jgi:hypothetical protein
LGGDTPASNRTETDQPATTAIANVCRVDLLDFLFFADSLCDLGANKIETRFCILVRIVASFRVLNMDLKVIPGQSLEREAITLETLWVWVELEQN